jgi:Poxvirus A32 protein
MANYAFKKFDLGSIPDDKVIVISARRGDGKSTLVKDLLHAKRHIPAGIVLSGTEESTGFYSDFVPSSFIYSGFNQGAIEKLLARQKRLLREKADNVNAFCVLDDVAYDKSVFKQECIREVFFNGRHLKIFFILTTQFLLDLPPALRANIDYFIAFADNNTSNRKRLYDHYFGCFPKPADFTAAFQALTKDYCSMILDNTSKSGNIHDSVMWYKSKLHPPFRLGSSAYWQYNRDFQRNKHKEEHKEKGEVSIVKKR